MPYLLQLWQVRLYLILHLHVLLNYFLSWLIPQQSMLTLFIHKMINSDILFLPFLLFFRRVTRLSSVIWVLSLVFLTFLKEVVSYLVVILLKLRALIWPKAIANSTVFKLMDHAKLYWLFNLIKYALLFKLLGLCLPRMIAQTLSFGVRGNWGLVFEVMGSRQVLLSQKERWFLFHAKRCMIS